MPTKERKLREQLAYLEDENTVLLDELEHAQGIIERIRLVLDDQDDQEVDLEDVDEEEEDEEDDEDF